MDFVPLIERIGENASATLGGLVLGAVFGFCVQRTAFCTRSAVIDVVRGRSLRGPATWIIGFAAALLIVQAMLGADAIAIGDSRYFATGQSLSGPLIGGAIFGVGMMLTRGCVSRLLVLGAGGNLRALYGILIVAVVSSLTLYGFLTPLRDSAAGLLNSAATGGNALVNHTGGGNYSGAIAGAIVAVLAIGLAIKARLGFWQMLGAALVGGSVAAGWYFTATLNTQVFEPIAVDSMSFIRPLAQTTGYFVGAADLPTFDLGLVVGTLAGGLVAAVAFRAFRVATFAEDGAPSILRYTVGAVLMGFGGVLAAGCTIGAGLTGGSALAISALIAIVSMIVAGAVTDVVVDRPRSAAESGAVATAQR